MPLNMGNVRPEFITILSVQSSDQARAGRMIPAVNGSPPLKLSMGLHKISQCPELKFYWDTLRNRRLNTLSRCESGTLVRKDNNCPSAQQQRSLKLSDLYGQVSQFGEKKVLHGEGPSDFSGHCEMSVDSSILLPSHHHRHARVWAEGRREKTTTTIGRK